MTWLCRNAAIADAFVVWLNNAARDWNSVISTFTRTWQPDMKFEGITTLTGEVAPWLLDPYVFETRGQKRQDYQSLLVLRQLYVPPANQPATIPEAWIDARAAVLEDIADSLDTGPTGTVFLAGQPAGFTVYAEKIETDFSGTALALQNDGAFLGGAIVHWCELRPR